MRRPARVGFCCRLVLQLLAIGLAFCADTAVSTGAAAPTLKVVRQYALTSANDFPQRDPQDWRLLGSNDGGQTWTTLDSRKGEVFTERHQRRMFKLAQPGGYNVYRLQIDRVRAPAEAESVQLAEIEPLGETENDLEAAPLPEDRITAQGDYPPLEERFQAFDGRVETKWLDHATQFPESRASWIQWQYTSPVDLTITNLQRLQALRNRARRSYPVRLTCVVVGHLAGNKTVCLLDATGSMAIPENKDSQRLIPGQRVVVEGRSQWAQQVEITQLQLHPQGPPPATEPRVLRLDQSLNSAEEWQWAEVEGWVRFRSRSEQGWMLELADNQQALTVRVLQPQQDTTPLPLDGSQVRVRGVCQSALDGRGGRVVGTLWVANREEVTVLAPPNAPLLPAAFASLERSSNGPAPELTRIEQLRQLAPEKLVRWPKAKIRGVITEPFGTYLQESNAGVEVWYGTQFGRAPGLGTYVEIEGRGDWATGHGPIIRADKVSVMGRGKLPAPERCSWSQLASGQLVDQWVEIEGVVRATDGSHLLLNSEGGRLMATVRSASAHRVKELVDALVRVRGVNVAATDNRGRLQGIQVVVPSLEFVEVEQAATDPFALPARPLGRLLQVRDTQEFVHRVKVEGVLTFCEGRNFFLQDASGGAMAIAQEDVTLNVPAGGWNWMFWRSTSSNRNAQLEWKVGDHLQVVGFPEMRGYAPVLTEVLARKTTSTNAILPVLTTVADLAGGGLDATLVSLEAEVLREELLGSHVVLELQSDSRVFQAYLQPRAGATPVVAPGSRIRVTGVCQVEPLPDAGLGKGVASFKLLVGSAADLKMLVRPSWWTLRRALAVAVALVVVLALAAGWIGILRRQVEERTKQLQRAIAEHEKTEARLALETQRVQAEIEERKRTEAEVERGHRQLLQASRLAGMAEVATSVLHNVGNVLNSANVLASLIVEQVQRSKTPSLARLAALLGEHRADLGGFVTADPRGKELPGYVERLAGHLQQEQSKLLEKTRLLTESIQHIKEIVAMQQNYAKVSGVLETVSLTEIVEDALRMHEGGLTRHQIELRREFESVPPVTLDRHKLLQILFNLLENAKFACSESGRAERQVTVRVGRRGQERLLIEVVDNGIGIPAVNLGRLFDQQFSTRKGGHGFGLHSCMLAAQEMGAKLSAHSDGPGQGALFSLQLPLIAPSVGTESI